MGRFLEAHDWARIAAGLVCVLGLAGPLEAQAGDGDGALLAIFVQRGQLAAGMMCYSTESEADPRDLPQCRTTEVLRGDICRLANSDLINRDIIAFDVTAWPRQAIAALATKVRLMGDPLNYDFAKAKVIGRPLRRVEENAEDELLRESDFELGAGCYLLMKITPPAIHSGC